MYCSQKERPCLTEIAIKRKTALFRAALLMNGFLFLHELKITERDGAEEIDRRHDPTQPAHYTTERGIQGDNRPNHARQEISGVIRSLHFVRNDGINLPS
jgi:hypothetical protein